jgi:hypothetical protein
MNEQTAPSQIQPVVFVFPLSEMARWLEKKLPAQYAGCAGYWHRSAHEAQFEALGAIEEPKMSEKEADKIIGWVDEYVDVCSLRDAIYTDDEYWELDETDGDVTGFHAGASFDQAAQALAAGGFRVVRAPFPQSLSFEQGEDGAGYVEQVDLVVARIEHHLDYASLELCSTMLEEDDLVSMHIRHVVTLLDNFLGSEPTDRLALRLIEAQAGWSNNQRDALHLALSEKAKWAHVRSKALSPNVPRLRESLPAVQHEALAEALRKREAKGAPAKVAPRKAVKVGKS